MKKNNSLEAGCSLPLIFILFVFCQIYVCHAYALEQAIVAKSDNINCVFEGKLSVKQYRAEKAVTKLKSYKELKKTLGNDKKLLISSRWRENIGTKKNQCIWEVSVYIDFTSEKRRALWHIFLVDDTGRVNYVMDSDGEFVKPQLQP